MEKDKKNTNQKVKMHKIMFAVGVGGVIGLNIVSWKSVAFRDRKSTRLNSSHL